MKRTFIQLFRILISILFVFSAISKILSLTFFDGLVAELFLGKQYYDFPTQFYWIQIFTRVIIAGELLLAVAILHDFLLKQVVLPFIQIILIGFTIHLTYMGFEKGFIGGNCGCFGDLVPMDNFESIVKNVLSILMVAYIQWKYTDEQKLTFKSWIPIFTVGSVTFLTLFLTVKKIEIPSTPITEVSYGKENLPTPIIFEEDTLQKDSTQQIKTDSLKVVKSMTLKKDSTKTQQTITIKKSNPEAQLLAKYTNFSTGKVDLNQGEKLICMFSLTCGHCQEAYKQLVDCEKNNKIPNIYLICYGKETDLNYFFSQAGGKHPYILMSDYEEFQRLLAGSDFPKILHHKEEKTLKFWDLETYKLSRVKEYFGIKEDVKTIKEPKKDNGGNSLFKIEEPSELKF